GIKKNDKYIISVTDRGCGIEDSQIEKIVNPFYIIDKSRSKNQGNTGLGLSICDKIAKLHNSNLEIKSELKKGTTISIILEVEDEE
ncbi:MAG: ATP-binding protein, partial [Peptostreptococcaceae bacterium]|nr:ATP-binding protein [Peptostreptococcaceae bacterium]